MAADIQKLYNLPDVSFIEDITYETILNDMIEDYQRKFEMETGQKIVLRPGDKEHIQSRIYAGQFYQMYERLDNAAKMNLLKYSRGDFLKHLGAFKKTFIQEPRPAIVRARFFLSEVRKDVVYIPKGTRITAGDGVYFATDDFVEAAAGQEYVDADCICDLAGDVGNDYIPGQIQTIVDPVPYVAGVENITK